MTTSGKPLSLREAAERLGVHYMTAYRYVRTGRLPARREGALWLVDRLDLDRLRDGRRGRTGSRRARGDRVATLTARMAAGDEAGAWRAIEEVLSSGMDPAEVYLDLLVPALRGLGDGWAEGTVTVAQEHRASAVAFRMVGRLGPRFARRGRKRGAVIVGVPAGDQHSLPSAIVADLLRGEGFEVVDIGANAPASAFAETARHTTRLVAVVVGSTTPGRDGAVRSAIRAIRASAIAAPVLVGGAAIHGADHAIRLGADDWSGRDGRSVISAVERASRSRERAIARPDRQGDPRGSDGTPFGR